MLCDYDFKFIVRGKHLDEQALDLGLHGLDLVGQLLVIALHDGEGDDVAGDLGGASEGGLAGDEDVGDVLILAQEGEVEEDLDGVGVTGKDDEIGEATVEGLGGLVGALTDQLGVAGLLDDVEDSLGQVVGSHGEGLIGNLRHDFKCGPK